MAAYELAPMLFPWSQERRTGATQRVVAEMDEAAIDVWAILCVRADRGQQQPIDGAGLRALWADFFFGTPKPPQAFERGIQVLVRLGFIQEAVLKPSPAMSELLDRLPPARCRAIDDLQVQMLREALQERRVQPARARAPGGSPAPSAAAPAWVFALG